MPSKATWPPSGGCTTVVVPRKDAVFQTVSATHIAAPASLVFEILLNNSEYGQWNTWVPNAPILEQPSPDDDMSHMRKGTIMNFAVIMDAKKPDKIMDTGLQVTDISTPEHPTDYISAEVLEKDGSFTADLSKVYRLSWTTHGGWVAKGLKSERFHEVIVTGENECEVRTWEVMGGILAYTVKWMFQSTLQDKFKLWMSDLKRWSEKRYVERGAST